MVTRLLATLDDAPSQSVSGGSGGGLSQRLHARQTLAEARAALGSLLDAPAVSAPAVPQQDGVSSADAVNDRAATLTQLRARLARLEADAVTLRQAIAQAARDESAADRTDAERSPLTAVSSGAAPGEGGC